MRRPLPAKIGHVKFTAIEAKADLAAHTRVGWSLQVNTFNGRKIPGRPTATLMTSWANNSNEKDV